jgi:hypothetical protein
MPINITYPELKETKSEELPIASLETLKRLREDMCKRDFKMQSHQRFLRRVLSPDSPVRGLLMVHGTGTGKTCSAIQIAEEYILRPEFQSKKILVLANPAVQENFREQIFDMSRVQVDDSGLLISKQCTGRRYLDILQRIQSEPLKWSNKTSREKLKTLSNRIISEFYEFQGYNEFANILENKDSEWITETFNDKIIIVDEAHSLRSSSENETSKLVSSALENVIKTAKGITLILLTATPMYDTYDEILYYFTLFLWNDRKLDLNISLSSSKIFNSNGTLKADAGSAFRGWCQSYISFIRGDNPMTFPFRLPPPSELVAPSDRTTDPRGEPIKQQRSFLPLVGSIVQGEQAKALIGRTYRQGDVSTLIVYPGNKTFRETFTASSEVDAKFRYNSAIRCLAPSKLKDYSSKFAKVLEIIEKSVGIIFVYSNYVESGAQAFAMCMEEYGYTNAVGTRLLEKTSEEVPVGSKGKYILFTAETSDMDLKRSLMMIKSPENVRGEIVKVIVASPRISEGVDMRYIRQIHVLDPWLNMSRIEQVVGRGIRTCSHQMLPFEEQNCTIYLHICRYPNSKQETVDEYMYRHFVETKATRIAPVKRVLMESAMDCELQQSVNNLPEEWRNLSIPQIRSQDGKTVSIKLSEAASPTFESVTGLTCNVKVLDTNEEHVRPLSAYLDLKDELFDKFIQLFLKKPIWKKEDLLKHPLLRVYDQELVIFLLHHAIDNGLRLKDANGRIGHLESKGNVYAYAIGSHDTIQDRTVPRNKGRQVEIVNPVPIEETAPVQPTINLDSLVESHNWVIKDLPPDVLKWYIVDHVLSAEQRLQHMLELDWENPPIYARSLKADGPLYVLGESNVYDATKTKITPSGSEADAYESWLTERKSAFINSKNSFFATMKGNNILFSLDESGEDLKNAERSKSISGRMCTTYKEKKLNDFAVYLGKPFPSETKFNKQQRCEYISLLFRDAVLKKKEGLVWWTPEEWSIFSEKSVNKELRDALKK